MDEQTARMIQQLKSNPAMLQALMQSRDGQDLLRMLSGGDQGASLQRAAQSAAKGNGGDGPYGESADAEPGRRGIGRPHQQGHERPVSRRPERGRARWRNSTTN